VSLEEDEQQFAPVSLRFFFEIGEQAADGQSREKVQDGAERPVSLRLLCEAAKLICGERVSSPNPNGRQQLGGQFPFLDDLLSQLEHRGRLDERPGV